MYLQVLARWRLVSYFPSGVFVSIFPMLTFSKVILHDCIALYSCGTSQLNNISWTILFTNFNFTLLKCQIIFTVE